MADHFVIDGSNLATEGRTEPSLAQLHEAVDAFRGEHPGTTVTVVVDASFEHRIDPSERAAFSKAEIASEVVSPPAGAVGRGDGFLLQIANRTKATVVSNDSFQEFHADYQWLFEPGRLIGGKPVPGVGWIFSLRRPVRGIVSRKTTQKAKRDSRNEDQVRDAIAEATADAMSSNTGRRRRRGGRGRTTESTPSSEPEAVNQPAPFLQFVIDHRLGTEVEGIVDAFSSHGAFVTVDDVRCYIPIAAMGEPRPLKARDVLTRGEARTFVIQAVDAPRRGIELALPGFAKVAGAPSDETVEADVLTSRPKRAPAKSNRSRPTKTPAKAASKTPAKSAAKTAAKTATKTATKTGTKAAPKAAAKAGAVTGVRSTAAKTAAARTAAKAATAKQSATVKKSAPKATKKSTKSAAKAPTAATKSAAAKRASTPAKQAPSAPAKRPAARPTAAKPTAAAKKPAATRPAKQPPTKAGAKPVKKSTAKSTKQAATKVATSKAPPKVSPASAAKRARR